MFKRYKYIYVLCLVGVLLCNIGSAQTIQLFLEDFNTGNNFFTLNSGGPASNTGQNQWIVNKDYNGNGIYPNTTSEHNTVSGTITEPDSNYLHIYDSAQPTAADCNYDNNTASDNFAYIGGFCTLGMINIHFTFFYLAEGTASDYGTVYYRLDGGPWIQCGQPQYNNQTLWKYEDITNPAFANHFNVQFGFRWTNGSSGGPNKMSFGIDDVIAVGTYDSNNPVVISVPSASPNPSCQGNNVTLNYSLSAPLCDGTYQIYISNAQGSFNGGANLGGFEIYAGDTSGAVDVTLPSGASGTCFKFRIDRVTPAPVITGASSTFCFSIIKCPNTITTLQPSVTFGPDTLCDNSAIDVPFFSTGTFNGNNKYIAQLSDANGSFANPQTLGTDSPDPNAYDPTQGSPPGTVSGLVPTTPPGCDYYIRVVSTSPAVTPPPANYFGPFCIRQCDVTTNNEQDIHVCIGDTTGADTLVSFAINSWKKGNVKYGPGNKFIVQLINMMTYQVVNTGGLGAVVTQTGTTIDVHVPGLDSLENVLGLMPGTYYLRFISTNSNSPADTLGTLVRITIGYSDPTKPILEADDDNFAPDSIFCAGALVYMWVDNINYSSQYQWKSNLNFGLPQPFTFFPPLGFTLNAQTKAGVYWFIVREDNNGCFSPWSDTARIIVLTKPNANVTGTTPLCVGDTDILQTSFQNDTYYHWRIIGDTSHTIKTANNVITVVFDSAGVFTVIDSITNQCASAAGIKQFTVYPKPTLQVMPGVTICQGGSANLSATTNATTFEWDIDTTKVAGAAGVIVKPDSTTSYIALATSDKGCKQKDTVKITVNINPVVSLTSTPVTCFGQSNGAVVSQVQKGLPPYSYLWSNGSDSTAIVNVPSGTYVLTVTDMNLCTDTAKANLIQPAPIGISSVTTYATYGESNGTATAGVKGGTPPYNYTWNTNPMQIGSEAVGLAPGEYTVVVTDSEGCSLSARVDITYAPDQIFIPNVFSPNNDGINDEFSYFGTNLSAAHTMIFNRWGEKIFESESLEQKWDGTYKGLPVDVGVYVYVIQATFADGKTATKSGNVTVLR